MNFDMERTAMKPQRSIKMVAACAIAFSLQGCIAAAFPIAASGLMASGAGSDPEAETTRPAVTAERPAQPAPTPVAPDPTGVVEVARSTGSEASFSAPPSAAGSENLAASQIVPENTSGSASDIGTLVVEETENTPAIVAVAPAPTEATASAPGTGTQVTNVSEVIRTDDPVPSVAESAASNAGASAVPAPAIAPSARPNVTANAGSSSGSGIVIPIPTAPASVAGGTFFDPLFSYATDPELLATSARPSAMLLNPAALEPERIECTEGEPTVLIDLDPETGSLFPIDISSASPALAERLTALRVRGVSIAWISQQLATREAEVRGALRESGLDALGIDDVLLMRTADERKQTRRDQLARGSCLIAIAGDSRADFHELFDYLLNPGDARELEPLIGEGWFLIPTPLLAERTRP